MFLLDVYMATYICKPQTTVTKPIQARNLLNEYNKNVLYSTFVKSVEVS